jgi:hypothetical protein
MSVIVRARKDKEAYNFWIFINDNGKRRAFKIGPKSDAEAIASELRRTVFFKELITENFELKVHNHKLIQRIEWLESQIEKQNRRKGPRKLPMVVFGD